LAHNLEAVDLCWKLAEERPARYNHDLAFLLSSLAVRFSNLNQDEEALAHSLEAVKLCQKLSEGKSATCSSVLTLLLCYFQVTASLTNFDQNDEALVVSLEGVCKPGLHNIIDTCLHTAPFY
jgi:hypothetical protein